MQKAYQSIYNSLGCRSHVKSSTKTSLSSKWKKTNKILSTAQHRLSSMHETKNVASSRVRCFKQKHKYSVHIYNHFLGCIMFSTFCMQLIKITAHLADHWKANKRDGFATIADRIAHLFASIAESRLFELSERSETVLCAFGKMKEIVAEFSYMEINCVTLTPFIRYGKNIKNICWNSPVFDPKEKSSPPPHTHTHKHTQPASS